MTGWHRRSLGDETGSGLVDSITGVTVFLSLLFLATHLVLNLYATSTVTAVAFDAARIVAAKGGGQAAEAQAEAQARRMLSRYQENGELHFEWNYPKASDAQIDRVELRVLAEHPTNLLAVVPMPYQRVDRTLVVRMERVRESPHE